MRRLVPRHILHMGRGLRSLWCQYYSASKAEGTEHVHAVAASNSPHIQAFTYFKQQGMMTNNYTASNKLYIYQSLTHFP